MLFILIVPISTLAAEASNIDKVHCAAYGGSHYILTALHPLEDRDHIFPALPLA